MSTSANSPLREVHSGTLQRFVDARATKGVKTRTINIALGVVRRILNLAASEWVDENGLTWLEVAPRVKLLAVRDSRAPYPMSWEEQLRLLQELPAHLAQMALFKLNTSCREQEVCSLQWSWEVDVPEIGGSVFLIPARHVKNRRERLVVLNDVAASVIESVRGTHPIYAFTYRGHRVDKMDNSAWKKARRRAELEMVRVHDLKHTFGRRLRAAGVSFEDRQDLLGHKSSRVTTHYSAAELGDLLAAANRVCDSSSRKTPALTIIKRRREA